LDHPGGAPANVAAQSEYNNNRNSYLERVKHYAIESKSISLPSHIKIPHPDTDPSDPAYQKRIRKLREEFKLNNASLYDDVNYNEEDNDDPDGDLDYDYEYEEYDPDPDLENEDVE